MTDRSTAARSTSQLSSSAFLPATRSETADVSYVRPRNRRLISTGVDEGPASPSPTDSGLLRPTSSIAAPRRYGVSPNRAANGDSGNLGQFLGESWTQSWGSVQAFANSLLEGTARSPSRTPSRTRGLAFPADNSSKSSLSWGPQPPRNPELRDVAVGSLAQREAALKAARTASVLESHDDVNGGLDVSGKHKRRNSTGPVTEEPTPLDYIVYIHKVSPIDTYAGVVLKYKCREDAFRKANGLWSRDSVQTRKWLMMPVDACEIRGRPCDPPSWQNANRVDLLAPTPSLDEGKGKQAAQEDFFSVPINGSSKSIDAAAKTEEEEEKLWTHVRWILIDSFPEPIEIGRVARQSLGYFPPRRRKSMKTLSSFSTPRHSMDLVNSNLGSADGPLSPRHSSLGTRPKFPGTPMSSRSRVGSDAADGRPAWMHRSGGVGSMERSVRAPGPDMDYFNKWAKKHVPGLNVAGLPSMSIMGSETANFGFDAEEATIVERSYEAGRDTSSTSRQGTGLDKAAAAVEMWLRGAMARRPATPVLGGLGRAMGRTADANGDLIELTDTGSEDGRLLQDSAFNTMPPIPIGSSSRSVSKGNTRPRMISTVSKGDKAE